MIKMTKNKKNISLKSITKKDLPIIIEWRNKEGVRDYNTQFILLNLKIQENWFEQIKEKKDRKMFLINYKNQKSVGVCGLINLDLNNHNAEIAIIIGEKKFHGKGIGKETLINLLNYGFQKLNLHRISANVFEFNVTSQKFFESLDFQYEYSAREKLWRRGKWWDVLTYSILKDEFMTKIKDNL